MPWPPDGCGACASCREYAAWRDANGINRYPGARTDEDKPPYVIKRGRRRYLRTDEERDSVYFVTVTCEPCELESR